MSTQVLGDVELVTKQELEAALDAVVVPEDDIDSKIRAAGTVLEQAIAAAKAEVHSEVEVTNAALTQETTNRTAKDAEIIGMIHDEAQLRETTDDALRSRIEREEGVREAADHELSELIAAETAARKEADEQETTNRTAKDAEIIGMIHDEAQLRETTDDALRSRIEREEGVREAADHELSELIAAETAARKEADEQETTNRTAKDAEIIGMIHDEAQLRETTDDALRSRIEREEGVREAADHELSELIAAETAARKEADEQVKTDIKEEMKQTQSKVFEDTVFCSRMKNLPLAQMTIEVTDRTIAVGDIIGTVDADYIPATPVTVSFIAELSDDKSYHIGARLDATGNVIVISKTELAEVYAGNVNSVTVMYITKE